MDNPSAKSRLLQAGAMALACFVLGHAGAIMSGNKGTAEAEALTEAGVPIPLCF